MRIVFILTLALPLCEIVGFVVIGGQIGVLYTLAALVLAGLCGAALLRGLRRRRQSGIRDAAETVLLALAAILLIFPGFVSDILAVPLVIGPLRRLLVHLGLAGIANRFGTMMRAGTGFGDAGHRGSSNPAEDIVDADYEIVDPDRDHDRDRLPGSRDDHKNTPWS